MMRAALRPLAALFALGAAALAPGAALAEEGGHWSVLSYFPGLSHTVAAFGQKGWLFGKEVHSGDHVVLAIIVAVLAIGLALAAAKRVRDPEGAIVPDARLTPLTFFEIILEQVLGAMESMMGRKKALDTYPIIVGLAVFILMGNCLGLIPGLGTPDDNLNMTLAMAISVFFLTHYYGVKYNGLAYFKHFLGPIVKWYALPLMLLMLVIELISHLARPASLSLRLFGNMTGDHKVLSIFLGFTLLFVPLPMMVLGLLVSVVQTLVFTLLAMVYFALAVEEADH